MVKRANKAYIDEHCNMYLDLMSETPELVYHPVMMKCYHDLFISNDYKQNEQDRSFLAFKSWLTTYRWKEIREYFRSKLGYIPDVINNKTYIDDEENIEKQKCDIIDEEDFIDEDDYICDCYVVMHY